MIIKLERSYADIQLNKGVDYKVIENGTHICGCENKLFTIVATASTTQMLFKDMLVQCIECKALYDAKTGSKHIK